MFRSLISSFFVVALTFGAASVEAAGKNKDKRTLIVNSPSAGSLNLRSGPGNSYSVIMSMPHGMQVIAIGRSGDWVQLRARNGVVGYAYRSYLRRKKR